MQDMERYMCLTIINCFQHLEALSEICAAQETAIAICSFRELLINQLSYSHAVSTEERPNKQAFLFCS